MTKNYVSLDSALSAIRPSKKNAFNQQDYQTRIRTGNGTTIESERKTPHVNFEKNPAPQSVHSRRCMAEGDINNQYIVPKSKGSEVTSSIKTSGKTSTTNKGKPAL